MGMKPEDVVPYGLADMWADPSWVMLPGGHLTRLKPLFGPERKTVREVWADVESPLDIKGTVALWEWTEAQ